MGYEILNINLGYETPVSEVQLLEYDSFADVVEDLNENLPTYVDTISNDLTGISLPTGNWIVCYNVKLAVDSELMTSGEIKRLIEKMTLKADELMTAFFNSNNIIFKLTPVH